MATGVPVLLAESEATMKRTLRTFALAMIAVGGLLVAQDQAPGGPEPDGAYEPGRAVARISVLNGDVSVRRGDSGDVVAAAINGPVMADDRVFTGSGSRAEIELDFANFLRIGPGAEVRFTGMDIKNFQIQVAAGTVTLRVLRPGQAQTEVETPSVAVHPLQPGIYRILTRDDGSSEVTVRSGAAEIFSSGDTERLVAGQTMNTRGSGADTEYQVVQAIPQDNWDRWNDERDRYLQRSTAYQQRVSPDVTGAEDLDQYGRWTQDPAYGQVWSPNDVPDGWAPYQNGRWVWEDYYGWTWVSYDPWGWAPYHYGRWFWGGGGWYWWPGPIHARYYWSPALVGFFGWGGGVGVGFGFGGVGWVPLAPYEVFHPWWGRGYYAGFRNGGFGHTTIVNNVNIYNTYRNARVNGAVMGATTADFGRRAQFRTLDRSQIQSAGSIRGAVPVAPDRTSLRMSDRSTTGIFTQSRATNFTSHVQATRADRVGFDQQQRGMQQMSRSSFGGGNAGSAGKFSSGGSSPGGSAAGGGWRRVGGDRSASPAPGGGSFNTPSTNAPSGGSAAPQTPAPSHDWGRFGQPMHGSSTVAPPAANSRSQQASSGGGWRNFQSPQSQSAQAAMSSAPRTNFAGQPVRISPSIVQQRPSYSGQSSPRFEAPRGGGESRGESGYRGGGGGRSDGSHSSGGSGHSGGEHSRGGHR